MNERVTRRVRLPDRCSCSEFVIRETTGADEQQAAILADARGAGTSIFNELVRLSLVEVDGEPVIQPYIAIDLWNSRTRSFLRRAYDKLNDVDPEEIVSFLAQMDGVGVSQGETD